MTTTNERVEITPELLAKIEEAARKAKGLPWHLGDYRGFGSEAEGEYDVNAAEGWELTGVRGTFQHRANAELCILLANSATALVERIRELESTNNELWRLFEETMKEIVPHYTARLPKPSGSPLDFCPLILPHPSGYP